MNATPLFDMFVTLFLLGLLLSIGTLVTLLFTSSTDERRLALPRAIARRP